MFKNVALLKIKCSKTTAAAATAKIYHLSFVYLVFASEIFLVWFPITLIGIKCRTTPAFTFCYYRNNLRGVRFQSKFHTLKCVGIIRNESSPGHTDTGVEPQFFPAPCSCYFDDTCRWFTENQLYWLTWVCLSHRKLEWGVCKCHKAVLLLPYTWHSGGI